MEKDKVGIGEGGLSKREKVTVVSKSKEDIRES